MADFNLEISLKQIEIIVKALDIYLRLGLGQLERVVEEVNELHDTNKSNFDTEVLQILKDLKKALLPFLSANGSYGVSNEKVHDSAKIAYDMLKTLEKGIAVVRNLDGLTVWHDGPVLHVGSEPIPALTIKNGDFICLSKGLVEQSDRVFFNNKEISKEVAVQMVFSYRTVKCRRNGNDLHIFFD